MKGICLTFFTNEMQKHKGTTTYEWLLEFAKKHGMPGGSVFRGVAGYGRHGVIHEEHFFELASNVPIEVVFILSDKHATKFLSLLKKEEPELFFTKSEVDYKSSKTE